MRAWPVRDAGQGASPAFVRTLAAATILICIGGAVIAGQRIYTNPKPDAQLKRLFPSATVFSSLTGTPLHFTAYGPEPRPGTGSTPIGFAFWTTDLVPQEHGYHGPIHILVGMNLAGTLTGVVVDYDSEPYGYFSVELPAFAAQFANKNVRDSFLPGVDIDAVSRASISISSATRAIRDSSRMVARALLTGEH
jgi:transcriptional regulator of nitric oxide reductase